MKTEEDERKGNTKDALVPLEGKFKNPAKTFFRLTNSNLDLTTIHHLAKTSKMKQYFPTLDTHDTPSLSTSTPLTDFQLLLKPLWSLAGETSHLA